MYKGTGRETSCSSAMTTFRGDTGHQERHDLRLRVTSPLSDLSGGQMWRAGRKPAIVEVMLYSKTYRLQFPCFWAAHYEAEWCSRCMQSVARSGDARVSCVRTSPLFVPEEAASGRPSRAVANVLRKACLQRATSGFVKRVKLFRYRHELRGTND